MEKQSTVDEFFEKLPNEDKEEADVFDEKTNAEVKPKVGDTEEDLPEDLKNRHIRRTEQRLQKERETNIELAARLQTLTEMEKFAEENPNEINPDIAKMFDGSEVGKENALRLSKVLADMSVKAKEEAIREFEERQESTVQEQKKYENLIDNELESLEDEFNIDLTSNAPKARKVRREFLELVQDLSPKDENGDITGYADFGATFEQYIKSQQTDDATQSRKEEIASRGMQRSKASSGTPVRRTPGFDGWKTDAERGVI